MINDHRVHRDNYYWASLPFNLNYFYDLLLLCVFEKYEKLAELGNEEDKFCFRNLSRLS